MINPNIILVLGAICTAVTLVTAWREMAYAKLKQRADPMTLVYGKTRVNMPPRLTLKLLDDMLTELRKEHQRINSDQNPEPKKQRFALGGAQDLQPYYTLHFEKEQNS